MKKIILLLVICCYSCKEKPVYDYNYDNNNVVDTTAVAVDSTANVSEIIEEPTKELTFEEALETASIYELEKFIENNPSHSNIEKLRARQIDLEVDQIFNDEKTGQIPNSDRVGKSSGGISEVSIRNDTSCELIVRYSGNDSRMISIPAQESRSISINNGNYRVTASACNQNYSGTEELSGNYSSSYYISTSIR